MMKVPLFVIYVCVTYGDGSRWSRVAIIIQGVQLTQILFRQIVKHLTDVQILLDRSAVQSTVKFSSQRFHFIPIE